MREPNFIRPKRSPACTVVAFADAADDAARQHADDLAERRRCGPRDRPRARCARSGAPRFGAVGRQEAARLVGDAGQRAPVRDAVDVHVHRRQEDADLLPVALGGDRRLARARRPSPGRRPATARRSASEPMTRSGSRKKKPRNAASSTNGIAHHHPEPSQAARAASTSAPPTKGAPARSIPIMVWWPRGRATCPENWPARGGGSWRVEDARAATRDTG